MKKLFINFLAGTLFMLAILCYGGWAVSKIANVSPVEASAEEEAYYTTQTLNAQDTLNECEMSVLAAEMALEQAINARDEALENLAWSKLQDLKNANYADEERIQELSEKAGLFQ